MIWEKEWPNMSVRTVFPGGERTAAIGSVREAYREGDLRELKTQIHTTRDSESFKLMKVE